MTVLNTWRLFSALFILTTLFYTLNAEEVHLVKDERIKESDNKPNLLTILYYSLATNTLLPVVPVSGVKNPFQEVHNPLFKVHTFFYLPQNKKKGVYSFILCSLYWKGIKGKCIHVNI